MHGYFYSILVGAMVLSGCALNRSPATPPDSFEGVYRSPDQSGGGYILVKRHTDGNLYVVFGEEGQKPQEQFLNAKNSPARYEVVTVDPDALFVESESPPMGKISCLIGSFSRAALVCKVPKNRLLRLRDGMPGKATESRTGYIVIWSSPAGGVAFDAVRTAE